SPVTLQRCTTPPNQDPSSYLYDVSVSLFCGDILISLAINNMPPKLAAKALGGPLVSYQSSWQTVGRPVNINTNGRGVCVTLPPGPILALGTPSHRAHHNSVGEGG
ncbi:hypothetical protein NDU88_000285, partial [Pleurodeles waltl]